MDRRVFLSLIAISPIIAKEQLYNNDIYLTDQDLKLFLSVKRKIRAIKRYVGYGNFNLISLDQALKYMKHSAKLEKFTQKELYFIEKIFYEDPKRYGFYGKRTCFKITQTINKKDVYKVPHTGHYLYKGKPLSDYYRLKKDIGDNLILTSGVRNVLKQMDLYFTKIHKLNFNITKASKIIAPPGYSYHSISDFDVGKKGFGVDNFTIRFAKTKEFKQLKKLDYIAMRYTKNNKDGVRYEPWHIQVI
jgi:hypothetical protein